MSKINFNSYYLFNPEIVDKIFSFLNFEYELPSFYCPDLTKPENDRFENLEKLLDFRLKDATLFHGFIQMKFMTSKQNTISAFNFLFCSKKYYFLYYHDLKHIFNESLLNSIAFYIFTFVKNPNEFQIKIFETIIKRLPFNKSPLIKNILNSICYTNNFFLVEILLKNIADDNEFLFTEFLFTEYLIHAIEEKNEKIVEFLLKDDRVCLSYYGKIVGYISWFCFFKKKYDKNELKIIKLLLYHPKLNYESRILLGRELGLQLKLKMEIEHENTYNSLIALAENNDDDEIKNDDDEIEIEHENTYNSLIALAENNDDDEIDNDDDEIENDDDEIDNDDDEIDNDEIKDFGIL